MLAVDGSAYMRRKFTGKSENFIVIPLTLVGEWVNIETLIKNLWIHPAFILGCIPKMFKSIKEIMEWQKDKYSTVSTSIKM